MGFDWISDEKYKQAKEIVRRYEEQLKILERVRTTDNSFTRYVKDMIAREDSPKVTINTLSIDGVDELTMKAIKISNRLMRLQSLNSSALNEGELKPIIVAEYPGGQRYFENWAGYGLSQELISEMRAKELTLVINEDGFRFNAENNTEFRVESGFFDILNNFDDFLASLEEKGWQHVHSA